MFAFFLAVARLTRMGRLDRKWPFISVSALSRSGSMLQGGRGPSGGGQRLWSRRTYVWVTGPVAQQTVSAHGSRSPFTTPALPPT